jgi:hypothetical protein
MIAFTETQRQPKRGRAGFAACRHDADLPNRCEPEV